MSPDHVILVFRRTGRWWSACSPDFSGAHSQGRTLASARTNFLAAIADLHGIEVEGDAIRSRPVPGVVVEVLQRVEATDRTMSKFTAKDSMVTGPIDRDAIYGDLRSVTKREP